MRYAQQSVWLNNITLCAATQPGNSLAFPILRTLRNLKAYEMKALWLCRAVQSSFIQLLSTFFVAY